MLKHVSVLHFFLLLKTFNCAGISHFIYPMSSWYTFRLFLFFDYYEQRCYEHSCMCTSFWVNMFSFFLNIYLRMKLLDHMVTLFNLMRVARLFYKVAVQCIVHGVSKSQRRLSNLLHLLKSLTSKYSHIGG